MELDTAVLRRRMRRSFLPEPVPRDALLRALALATHAPSAGNAQGSEFIVLTGPETALFWEHQASSSWRQHPTHPGLLNAGAVVLPMASQQRYLERYAEPDKGAPSRPLQWAVPYWWVDTAFAVMLLLLALEEEGLAALFFALRYPAGPLLAELGTPDEWQPLGAVAVGLAGPGDKPSTSAGRPRRPLGGLVHWGRW